MLSILSFDAFSMNSPDLVLDGAHMPARSRLRERRLSAVHLLSIFKEVIGYQGSPAPGRAAQSPKRSLATLAYGRRRRQTAVRHQGA